MKLTTQDVAAAHKKTTQGVQVAVQRASKKGLNYIIIDGKCYRFFYENGLGRGGKTLFFVESCSHIEKNGMSGGLPSEKQQGDSDEDTDREYTGGRSNVYLDGVKKRENSDGSRTTGGYFGGGDSDGSGADKSSYSQKGAKAASSEDVNGGYSSGNSSYVDFGGARVCSRNENQKRADKVEKPLSQSAQGALTVVPEGGSVKVGIAELDKMNRVRAVNEFLGCPKGCKKTLWGRQIAQKYGVSLKTLYQWANLLKDEQKIKIEERDFSLEIDFSSNAFDKRALEWALGAWLHNPLATKQKIYEMLVEEGKENKWRVGSYKTFARLFDRADIKILLAKAIGGDRLVKNEYVPYIMRDLNKYKSMELICGDQIVFDWQVYDENGEVVNPNAYVWIDMGSSMVIGVDVVLGKYNKLSIGRSLKMALEYGVPSAIYTDNGKPELSRYISEIRSQLSGIKFCDFDELGAALVHKKARPRNSRAKPIEGIFAHIQRWMFESIVSELGGFGYRRYTKTNSDEWVKALSKHHHLMSWDVFVEKFLWAIGRWNAHKIKDRNIIPEEKFFSDLNGVTRFDEATLEYIFLPRRTLKVRNGWVQITEGGKKYTYSHQLLVPLNGESVDVRVSEDKKSAIISTKDGFLCEANLVEKIDPRDEEALRAALSQQNKITKAIKEAYSKYKDMVKPKYKINYYTNVANIAKEKTTKTKEVVKKIQMSDDELLKAM